MHQGPITKVATDDCAWILSSAPWTWIRCDPEAKRQYEKLKEKKGARRAIIAIARRLAVRVYHQVVHNDLPRTPLPETDKQKRV